MHSVQPSKSNSSSDGNWRAAERPHLANPPAADCPAAVAFAEDLNDDHRSVTLILPAWQLVNGLLEWFSRGASQDGSARLRFPPSLGKPHRAHIHQCVMTCVG